MLLGKNTVEYAREKCQTSCTMRGLHWFVWRIILAA